MTNFVPAVCPGCGAGCGLYLECVEDDLVLTAPSHEDEVSQGRLCMRGWQIGDMLRNSLRLGTPLIHGKPASWDEAMTRAADILEPLRRNPSRLGVLAAGHLTNEEGFAIAQFARQVLGTHNIDNFGRSVDGPIIWGLQHLSSTSYRRPPLRDLVDYDLIICLSSNIGHLNAQAGSWAVKAHARGSKLVVLDHVDDGMARAADLYLEHEPYALTAVLMYLLEALGGKGPGEKLPELARLGPEGIADSFQQLVDMINSSSRIAIMLATRSFSIPYPGMLAADIADQLNLQESTSAAVFAVNGTPNSVGLGHMGVVPVLTRDPGNGGQCLFDMIDLNKQALDGLVVVGEELVSWLDRDGMTELRDMLDVLIVLDSFRTATSRVADVTLPVSGYGEREGSFTTLDAKVRWNGYAIKPFGESRYLPEVLAELAVLMDNSAAPATVDDIWEQMRAQVGGYGGIALGQLRSDGEADLDFEAVPRNQDDTHEQREYYSPIEVADPAEWQYTVLPRYDAHWWIYDGRMWSLPVLYREMRDWRAAHVLMNTEDMAREQLRSGRPMILVTARGRAEVQVYPHPNLSTGLIVVPAHQRHLLDQLMGQAQYDCRSCTLVHRPTPAHVRRG